MDALDSYLTALEESFGKSAVVDRGYRVPRRDPKTSPRRRSPLKRARGPAPMPGRAPTPTALPPQASTLPNPATPALDISLDLDSAHPLFTAPLTPSFMDDVSMATPDFLRYDMQAFDLEPDTPGLTPARSAPQSRRSPPRPRTPPTARARLQEVLAKPESPAVAKVLEANVKRLTQQVETLNNRVRLETAQRVLTLDTGVVTDEVLRMTTGVNATPSVVTTSTQTRKERPPLPREAPSVLPSAPASPSPSAPAPPAAPPPMQTPHSFLTPPITTMGSLRKAMSNLHEDYVAGRMGPREFRLRLEKLSAEYHRQLAAQGSVIDKLGSTLVPEAL